MDDSIPTTSPNHEPNFELKFSRSCPKPMKRYASAAAFAGCPQCKNHHRFYFMFQTVSSGIRHLLSQTAHLIIGAFLTDFCSVILTHRSSRKALTTNAIQMSGLVGYEKVPNVKSFRGKPLFGPATCQSTIGYPAQRVLRLWKRKQWSRRSSCTLLP